MSIIFLGNEFYSLIVLQERVMCARCCLTFRRVNGFFFMMMYNLCLVSLSNFIFVLINWQEEFLSSNSVCNHTRDKQTGLPLRGCLSHKIPWEPSANKRIEQRTKKKKSRLSHSAVASAIAICWMPFNVRRGGKKFSERLIDPFKRGFKGKILLLGL